jgi:hypothetical protein
MPLFPQFRRERVKHLAANFVGGINAFEERDGNSVLNLVITITKYSIDHPKGFCRIVGPSIPQGGLGPEKQFHEHQVWKIFPLLNIQAEIWNFADYDRVDICGCHVHRLFSDKLRANS